MLIYVVEFKFESIANRLNDQIIRVCEEQGNRYVRSCSWTYSNWIDNPDLIVHYINQDLLKEHYQYGEGVVVGPLYKKLVSL